VSNGERCAVLVVEDDRFIRNLLVTLLRDEGLAVTEAANGAEALAVVTRDPPDLILLDLAMPVMDGSTFCRELQALGAPTIPVIILSAHGAREAQRTLGAQAAFNKPFDIDDVLTAVHRLLRARSNKAQSW
jgi:CheY-like chemotaxis protein